MKARIFTERGNLTIAETIPGSIVDRGLLVSTIMELQLDHVIKVFEYGSQKHDKIEDSQTQMSHLMAHFFSDYKSDEDSGLSNKAHAAARALLLFYALLREME